MFPCVCQTGTVHDHNSWEAWLKSKLISMALLLLRSPSPTGSHGDITGQLLWSTQRLLNMMQSICMHLHHTGGDIFCLWETLKAWGRWQWCGRQFRWLKSHLLVFPIRQQKRTSPAGPRVHDPLTFSLCTQHQLYSPLLHFPFLWLNNLSTRVWWGHSSYSL